MLIVTTLYFKDNHGTAPLTLSSELPYQSTIKRKVRKKKKNGVITANIAGTKYEIGRKLHILFSS